jgi:acylphosphatase
MVTKRVFFEGRVQGVGFRFSAKELAAGYEVTGFIHNTIDGRVEMEAQGPEDEVDAFIKAILASHLRAHITRWTMQPGEIRLGRKGFLIR